MAYSGAPMRSRIGWKTCPNVFAIASKDWSEVRKKKMRFGKSEVHAIHTSNALKLKRTR